MLEAGSDAVALNSEKPEGCASKSNDPDSKDGLNFSQEVEEVGLEGNVILRVLVRLGLAGESEFLDLLFVLVFVMVGHLDKEATQESVDDGAKKNDGGNDVEAALLACPVF